MYVIALFVTVTAQILLSFMLMSRVRRGRMRALVHAAITFVISVVVVALAAQIIMAMPEDSNRMPVYVLTVLASAWAIVSAWMLGDSIDNRKSRHRAN
jgi:Co/Zn/Cd efflux system component